MIFLPTRDVREESGSPFTANREYENLQTEKEYMQISSQYFHCSFNFSRRRNFEAGKY